MRKAQIAALTAATVVVAGCYYGLADALDLVPGGLTAAGADAQVSGFPSTASQSESAAAVAGLSTSAPIPSTGSLTKLAKALAADKGIGSATTAASVIDVATGTELLDYHAGKALTPASSTKLLTAWAALTLLGPEHTLKTRTVLSGSTVTLVGGGDVLLAKDKGDPGSTAGHAGLGDLARSTAKALKAKGVTSVSVDLDDTLFSSPTWNSAWESGNEDWVAPVQSIMVDVTDHTEGTAYSSDPAKDAAETFAKELGAAGITVKGSVSRKAAASGAAELAHVTSAPLADILAVSLKASDNTMTEVEGHLVAIAGGQKATFSGAVTAVLAQLKKEGIDTTGVSLKDSSGLALSDKVPARVLASIIAKAAGASGGSAGRTLISDLPVGALDGTLDDRFVGTAAAGRIRAKTGSLGTTQSLSGTVVTAGGRLLAFSVITDGFADGGLESAREATDKDFAIPLAKLKK